MQEFETLAQAEEVLTADLEDAGEDYITSDGIFHLGETTDWAKVSEACLAQCCGVKNSVVSVAGEPWLFLMSFGH